MKWKLRDEKQKPILPDHASTEKSINFSIRLTIFTHFNVRQPVEKNLFTLKMEKYRKYKPWLEKSVAGPNSGMGTLVEFCTIVRVTKMAMAMKGFSFEVFEIFVRKVFETNLNFRYQQLRNQQK